MAMTVVRRDRGLFPRLRKRMRNSFLFVPLTGLVVGWLLATVVVQADTFIHDLDARWESVELADLWFLRTAKDFGASAKSAVAAISSAMLTFIGVVFSITLVALQMAAGQFSPRVLRIYVESRVTKLTLAVFLCTFLYTLRVQKEYTGAADQQDAVVPYLGASLAMGFVVLSLVLFVVYVHSTIRLMRVTYVMDRVGEESLQLIRDSAAPEGLRGPDPDPQPDPGGTLVPHTWRPGVLQTVDVRRLVGLARREDLVLHLIPRIGDYLVPYTPLFRVSGAPTPSDAELQAALDLGVERTTEQDLAFGIRQLADISSRALSPAVNDPTTAVQALDRIQVLLTAFADQPLGRAHHRDADGVVRLVETLPSWPELLDLGLTEIRDYGIGSVQVTRRLAACLDDLERLAPADRREPVRRHRDLLEEAVRATAPTPQRAAFALQPDRQGIG
ncbi:DUF2254 domain-containing protein [Streptomyces sp. NBC_00249]|uniref:DUF2254 domain-containing protein n=1 Tax=Streptomyces sp. NBC_00249 TaxID=2975690 RepID=UPI002255FE3E|nr:DUF2254 domain-containing protein [Streptomyces sp. NBC_00249]MCX5193255.1 DUF2254 domain-containing protein [Streptomyces sp. NBC_00249]